eukprot:3456803-Amphidinium_carterae.2
MQRHLASLAGFLSMGIMITGQLTKATSIALKAYSAPFGLLSANAADRVMAANVPDFRGRMSQLVTSNGSGSPSDLGIAVANAHADVFGVQIPDCFAELYIAREEQLDAGHNYVGHGNTWKLLVDPVPPMMPCVFQTANVVGVEHSTVSFAADGDLTAAPDRVMLNLPLSALTVCTTSGVLPSTPQSLILHKIAVEGEIGNWQANGVQAVIYSVLTNAESASRVSEVTDMRRSGEDTVNIPLRFFGTTSARQTGQPPAGELATYICDTFTIARLRHLVWSLLDV